MKYLFVVQGEGRGHLTQAISLKQLLVRNGHEVVAVMAGSSKKRVLPDFFAEKMGTEIIQFQSPNFMPAPKNKKPFLLGSILYNLLLIPVYIESMFRIRNTIAEKKPDIVVNFYELVCGLTYGVLNPQVPMINLAHQYYFLTSNFTYTGTKKFQFQLLNFYSQLTKLNATKVLALSFRDEETDQHDGISIVPPLLRQEVLNMKSHKGDYIHGYILNDGYMKNVSDWSKKNPNEELHFFWDNKSANIETKINPNLTMHSLSDVLFLKYMAGAKAYATTSGFESVCEAMFLHKPVLMVPTHIEQECNAIDAIQSGIGVKTENFNLSILQNYIPKHTYTNDFQIWIQSAEVSYLSALTETNQEAIGMFASI